jgi:predicted nucleotidyltransferase
MNLDRLARAILDERGTAYILVGAHALGVYGVLRATHDVDFLTVDKSVLAAELWERVVATGATVKVMKGDFSDPLAGTVRMVRGPEQVDVVVGKWKFELAIIERAEIRRIGDDEIRVPRIADLVLLKVAAGGPQDMWDIHELLNHVDRTVTLAEVERHVDQLPSEPQALWSRLREELNR